MTKEDIEAPSTDNIKSYTVCTGCGEPLKLTDELELKKISERELNKLARKSMRAYRVLMNASMLVRKMNDVKTIQQN